MQSLRMRRRKGRQGRTFRIIDTKGQKGESKHPPRLQGAQKEQEEEEERTAHRLVRLAVARGIIAEGKEGGKRAKARLYPSWKWGYSLSFHFSLFLSPESV